MKFGHTTASLLIAKLHASSRQSGLAKALHQYGRLVRTSYAATSPTKNSAGGYAVSSTRARACTRCAATCSSPIKAMSAATTSTSRSTKPYA